MSKVKSILMWILSIFMFFLSLGAPGALTKILLIIIGLGISPPIVNIINTKFDNKYNWKVRLVSFLILFIFAVMISPTSNVNNNSIPVGNEISKTESHIQAETEQETKAKTQAEAEQKAKQEAEAKAKAEAEQKAKQEAEAKTQVEAEQKAKQEAEAKAQVEAEQKAKQETESKAQVEAEQKKQQTATTTSVTVPAPETGNNLVWIPTNGGTKYHSNPSCSNMKNPNHVTISTAEANGFTPCKKCY